MSETGGLKAIEVPSFCWLSSNCNKINEKTTEVWNCDKGRFSRELYNCFSAPKDFWLPHLV